MAAIALPLMIYGGISQYTNTRAEGTLAQGAANIQARQLEDAANAERGMAAIDAKEKRRQGTLLQSKAIAAAAAAGRAPSVDKGAANIIADIGKESEYNALTSLLEGNVKASNLQMEASTARSQGRINKKLSDKRAIGGLFSDIGQGIGTFGSKYS